MVNKTCHSCIIFRKSTLFVQDYWIYNPDETRVTEPQLYARTNPVAHKNNAVDLLAVCLELIKYNLIISTYLAALVRCGRLNLIIAVGKCCEKLRSYSLKRSTALVDQFSGRSLIKLHNLFAWTSFTGLFPHGARRVHHMMQLRLFVMFINPIFLSPVNPDYYEEPIS